jgi:prolipoprotein diacylglyceryltransferase
MLQVIYRIPIKPSWAPDGIPIYGFGMMLFFAFLFTTWLAQRRAVKAGIAKEVIQDLAIWIFIGGLLGARITFLVHQELQAPPDQRRGLLDIVKEVPRIWDGGIVLYGSVVGGLAAYALAYALIYRKKALDTLKLADVVAPSIALGLCLGRLGCFLNGCCYGQVACADCAVVPVHFPVTSPPREVLTRQGYQTAAGFTLSEQSAPVKVKEVAPHSAAHAAGLKKDDVITVVNGHTIKDRKDLTAAFNNWPRGEPWLSMTVERPDGTEVWLSFRPVTLGLYPTQLFEVISMGLLLLVLLAYEPLRRRPGQLMAVLMMGYGVHRYLNEILRDDARPVGFEKYSSWVVFAAGLVMWGYLQWSKSPAAPGEAVSPAPAAPAAGASASS